MTVRELIEKLKDMPPESQVLAPRYDGVGGEEWQGVDDVAMMKAHYDQRWGVWSVAPDGRITVTIT